MGSITNNLQAVKSRIAELVMQSGRTAGSVELLAVSKTWPIDAVLEAAAAGQVAFGENYVQEGVEKVLASRQRGWQGLHWHFIGPLQSNKTKVVAEHFDWVHTIDRLKIAERLSLQRPAELPPLNVCVQVNISGEASKSGCRPEEALTLAKAVAVLPRLQLRGLMAIPAPTDSIVEQQTTFMQLKILFEQLRQQGLNLDTLSAGMSHDLEAAITCGSTLVRVGTAIFGQRSTQ